MAQTGRSLPPNCACACRNVHCATWLVTSLGSAARWQARQELAAHTRLHAAPRRLLSRATRCAEGSRLSVQEALCQCMRLLLQLDKDPVVGADVTRDGDAWCTPPEVCSPPPRLWLAGLRVWLTRTSSPSQSILPGLQLCSSARGSQCAHQRFAASPPGAVRNCPMAQRDNPGRRQLGTGILITQGLEDTAAAGARCQCCDKSRCG